jgi:hypothetical protein
MKPNALLTQYPPSNPTMKTFLEILACSLIGALIGIVFGLF